MEKVAFDLILNVHAHSSDGYHHVTGSFSAIKKGAIVGTPGSTLHYVSDVAETLQLYSQAGGMNTSETAESGSYAWEIQSIKRHPDSREARAFVKVAGRIERKLERYEKEFGTPQTFGAWVQRVCKAAGCNNVSVQIRGSALAQCVVSPKQAASAIDIEVAQFHKQRMAA